MQSQTHTDPAFVESQRKAGRSLLIKALLVGLKADVLPGIAKDLRPEYILRAAGVALQVCVLQLIMLDWFCVLAKKKGLGGPATFNDAECFTFKECLAYSECTGSFHESVYEEEAIQFWSAS
eukprot:1140644-Pelagomonas_calceolata.AAC.3